LGILDSVFFYPQAVVRDLFRKLLYSDAPLIISRSIDALTYRKDAESFEKILAFYPHNDIDVNISIFEYMDVFDANRTDQILLDFLQHPDEDLKIYALETLAEKERIESIEAIKLLLDDVSEDVRKAAGGALDILKDGSVDT
jgi:HEAT repeat protein